ncbi:hypothetical protein KNE206_54520 [Kitasatospora sp. NE20-6]
MVLPDSGGRTAQPEGAGQIAGMAQFLPTRTTVLGHPAVEYVDHTTVLRTGGNGKVTTGGALVRHVMVAQDPAAPGGPSLDVAVFRQDAGSPDMSAVRRLAETLFPTLAGWSAARQPPGARPFPHS